MANITTPEVCATNKIHEGVRSAIKVAGQECFIGNIQSCLKCNGRQGLPPVILFKELYLIHRGYRGPINEQGLSETPH